jgi:hypothetical protein
MGTEKLEVYTTFRGNYKTSSAIKYKIVSNVISGSEGDQRRWM